MLCETCIDVVMGLFPLNQMDAVIFLSEYLMFQKLIFNVICAIFDVEDTFFPLLQTPSDRWCPD